MKDSRGTTIETGSLVFSFSIGDNYIVKDTKPNRVLLCDGQDNLIGWVPDTDVVFVAMEGQYAR